LLVRRERPHPGAQLSLFDTIEGRRHQILATDTPPGNGSIQHLEARHRAHARVEDRIRTGKDTGFGRFPSRVFTINQAWLQLALTGIDLLAWIQTLLLDGDLARAEPKKLRYRLLHVAARITRTARRTTMAIAAGWPWTESLTRAFSRLAALPAGHAPRARGVRRRARFAHHGPLLRSAPRYPWAPGTSGGTGRAGDSANRRGRS
jgi:hypothetical protein